MEEELKYGLIGGATGLFVYLVLEIIFWGIGATSSFCLSCSIVIIILNFVPLWVLHVKGISVFLISSIVYSLVGALIGYLIQRFRK